MSPEILTMLGIGIALASLIITGQRGLGKRIDGLDKRIDGLEKRIDGLDKRIDSLVKDVAEVRERLAQLEGLIERVLLPRSVLPSPPEDHYEQAV